ncbi:MAG: type VI secretion system baseplate subunit TssG [Gammaproteobacteria bacterium]|nr:type VI secretion system baseplate subunit TssG [Gammaproteobacteria bacterium]
MALAYWRQAINIIDDIVENGEQYDFYQAVRLLNRLSSTGSSENKPELTIRPDLNIDYPQSDIENVNKLEGGRGYEILTTFFGLYGVASPLPGYYTEELLDEEWEDHATRRGFLDVIHQQLYPLLYQAWLKYRFSHNAIETSGEKYWEIIFSLLGLPEEFRKFGDLSGTFLKYTGIINQRPKTQSGLKTILADYLKPLNVDIEPCVLRKVVIQEQQRCKLSIENNTLGSNTVIGEQVNDRSGKYKIHIGPLSIKQFQSILSDKKQLKFIQTISKLFMVQPLQCDIVLKLEKGSAQPICLGQSQYSCLGKSTWLVNQKNEEAFNVTLN